MLEISDKWCITMATPLEKSAAILTDYLSLRCFKSYCVTRYKWDHFNHQGVLSAIVGWWWNLVSISKYSLKYFFSSTKRTCDALQRGQERPERSNRRHPVAQRDGARRWRHPDGDPSATEHAAESWNSQEAVCIVSCVAEVLGWNLRHLVSGRWVESHLN